MKIGICEKIAVSENFSLYGSDGDFSLDKKFLDGLPLIMEKVMHKPYNEKKYLYYKVETLAETCGIASRTNFSNLFQKINGIMPADFIEKRLADQPKRKIDKHVI